MKGLIVFIGPSMVGKTTIANTLRDKLVKNKVGTDTLCHNHNYHEEDSIELFDDLRRYILKEKVSIVDIGSNTIESCTQEEIEYLVKSLTINEIPPKFYLILPHKNKNISFSFLIKQAKILKCNTPEVLSSISESLTCKNYGLLNPQIIYTLENYKQPILNKTKHYKNHLQEISKSLINELKSENSDTTTLIK